MNDDELTLTLLRKIETLENRIEYLEAVEKNVFSKANIGIATDPGLNCLKVVGNIYRTTLSDINDDAATSFTPTKGIGVLLINGRNANYDDASSLIAYRTSTTLFCTLIAQPSTLVETTTGALTGADGNDNKLTVSTHTDGKIYIENRTGYTVSLTTTLFGA